MDHRKCSGTVFIQPQKWTERQKEREKERERERERLIFVLKEQTGNIRKEGTRRRETQRESEREITDHSSRGMCQITAKSFCLRSS